MTFRRSIISKLWIYVTLLTVIILIFLGLVLSKTFEDFYFEIRKNELINEGQQLVSLILSGIDPDELLDISKFINAHAIIVDKKGLISACSRFINGKELSEVLKGKIVVHRGYIHQFNASMLTIALPIKTEREVIGGVILYAPMSAIQSSIWQIRKFILIAGGSAVLIATALSFFLSKTVSKPLVEMKGVAKDMAEGDFTTKVKVNSKDEIGALGNSINHLSNALEKNIAALSQEKNQLQKILLSMTDAVITFDLNNEVIMANPQANFLFFNDENDKKYYNKIFNPILNQVKKEDIFISEEIKAEGMTISAKFTPLKDKQELWGILAVMRDITMEKKLEKLRRKFVSNVSHELRTPLTYLQGYTEALLDGMAEEPADREKYLNIILDETLRLKRLVNKLLDLSLIESGNVKLRKDEISFPKLIKSVLRKFTPIATKNNINIELNLEKIPTLIADKDAVEQVLINLIDNSIRYSNKNSKIIIGAKNSDDGDNIIVSVKDEGKGIPEDELPFIWERFYKTDKARTRDDSGTGLGLSIVKNIINLHGGRVWARNRKEKGAAFYFSIPIRKQ